MAALFLQGSLYRGAGRRRRSERLFLNISRKTAGFVEYVEYIIYVLIYDSFLCFG